MHSLLRHLEHEDFSAAPRIIESGFNSVGRETLIFIERDFIAPGPWSFEAAYEIGVLLRHLHDTTSSYKASPKGKSGLVDS